jgi:hypothetical protein
LVIDDIIACVDLAMSLSLIVVLDPSAPSREYRLDAQQVCHLPRLENPALWVDQRNAFTAELEAAREIGGIQHTASEDREPINVAEGRLA